MKTPDKYIFLPSGCIREEAMFEYVRGGFSGEVKARIEHHLGHCVLCREAVEGIRLSEKIDLQQQHIAQLKHRLSGSLRMRSSFSGSGRRVGMYTVMTAAASIIIVVGIFSVIRLVQHRPQQQLAQKEEIMPAVREKSEPAGKTSMEKQDTFRSVALPEKKAERAPVAPAEKDKEAESTDAMVMEMNDEVTSRHDTIAPVTGVEQDRAAEMSVPSEDITISQPAPKGFTGAVAGKGVEDVLEKERAAPVPSAAKKVSVNYFESEVSRIHAQFVSGIYPDFETYIADSLHVPDTIMDGSSTWKVQVAFTVDTTGMVTNARVLQSGNSSLDKEALQVVRRSPRWKPASLSGRPVPEDRVVTVTFPPVRREQ